jgi:hypothetical protein
VSHGYGRCRAALIQGHIQMTDEVNAVAFQIRGCENLRLQGYIVEISRMRQDTDLGPQAIALDPYQRCINSISGDA